jgi:hypothetical protein
VVVVFFKDWSYPSRYTAGWLKLGDEIKRQEFFTKIAIQEVVSSIVHARETKQALIKEIIRKVEAKILSDEELLKRKRAHIKEFLIRIKGQDQDPLDKWKPRETKREIEEYIEKAHKLGIEVFGERPRSIKEKDWYSQIKPALQKYIDERKRLWELVKQYKGKSKYVTVFKAYRKAQKEESKAMQRLADDFFRDKCSKLDECIRRDHMKGYKAIIASMGLETKAKMEQNINSVNGILLTEAKDIQERWVHHFKNLLNIKKSVDPSIFDSLDQYDVDNKLAEEPTMEEMENAMAIMKNDKATGGDEICIEELRVYKEANPKAMLNIFCQVWRNKKIPQMWKDIDIVTIFKNKGSSFETGNYRGVSLVSQVGKVLAKIIDIRLQEYCEKVGVYAMNQYGFRKDRGVQDMIFAARRLQEMAKKLNMDLYWVFVDLTKAYDSVDRESLWKVLGKCGIPKHLIDIVADWHNGMQACIKLNGTKSEKFRIETGLRQGDVMAPTLFNIYFSMIIQVMEKRLAETMEKMNKDHIGVKIMYDTSVQCWEQKKKTTGVRDIVIRTSKGDKWRNKKNKNMSFYDLWNLLFADDAALVSTSKIDLQIIVSLFNEIAEAFGLSVSIKKTEVLHQTKLTQSENVIVKEMHRIAKKKKEPILSEIIIEGKLLADVYVFKYLGSLFNKVANMENELERRRVLASSAFKRLQRKVFKYKFLKLKIKMKLYNTIVLATLLWDCNNWILSKTQLKELERFHSKRLKIILGKTWKDKLTLETIYERTNSQRIEYQFKARRLKMIAKIERMPDNMLPKMILYGAIDKGEEYMKSKMFKTGFTCEFRDDLKLFDVEEGRWRHYVKKENSFNDYLSDKKHKLHDEDMRRRIAETNKRTTEAAAEEE